MPFAYYNEFDKSAAEWLRQLIKEGAITDGVVDERSIEDVVPTELAEFDRCHFFAGIGAWDYALTAAGWHDGNGQVWTGSCPCQPFSSAGKGIGFADERHLWPAWFHLIQQCRPRVIFGEQVSSKDTMPWIDLVHADLEGALYTVGAADLCSPSVGAPHIRQRLYFVADATDSRRESVTRSIAGRIRTGMESPESISESGDHRAISHDLADTDSGESRGQHRETSRTRQEVRLRDGFDAEHGGGIGQLGDALPAGRAERRAESGNRPTAGSGGSGDVADSEGSRRRVFDTENVGQTDAQSDAFADSGDRSIDGCRPDLAGFGSSVVNASDLGHRHLGNGEAGRREFIGNGPTNGFWRDAEWIYCRDGKWRPVGTVESGAFEMADELAADLGCVRDQSSGRYTISPLIEKGKGRVARLRGYGNAITAEVAIAFISSYLEVSNDE